MRAKAAAVPLDRVGGCIGVAKHRAEGGGVGRCDAVAEAEADADLLPAVDPIGFAQAGVNALGEPVRGGRIIQIGSAILIVVTKTVQNHNSCARGVGGRIAASKDSDINDMRGVLVAMRCAVWERQDTDAGRTSATPRQASSAHQAS